MFFGINLTFWVIVLALAGVGGPIPLVGGLFYGGIVMNFVGLGIVSCSLISKRLRGR